MSMGLNPIWLVYLYSKYEHRQTEKNWWGWKLGSGFCFCMPVTPKIPRTPPETDERRVFSFTSFGEISTGDALISDSQSPELEEDQFQLFMPPTGWHFIPAVLENQHMSPFRNCERRVAGNASWYRKLTSYLWERTGHTPPVPWRLDALWEQTLHNHSVTTCFSHCETEMFSSVFSEV